MKKNATFTMISRLCTTCFYNNTWELFYREYEFSYEDDPFPMLHKACRMRNVPVKFDVLLTSYQMVSQDYTTLRYIDWDVIIIDEAHRLKNNSSLVSVHWRENTFIYPL